MNGRPEIFTGPAFVHFPHGVLFLELFSDVKFPLDRGEKALLPIFWEVPVLEVQVCLMN